MAKTRPVSHARRGGGRKHVPRIRWTFELRLALHGLKTDYENLSNIDMAKIFSHVFREHLRGCGFTGGSVPASRLTAQYCDRSHKDWSQIRDLGVNHADAKMMQDLRIRIQQAIQELAPITPRKSEAKDVAITTGQVLISRRHYAESQKSLITAMSPITLPATIMAQSNSQVLAYAELSVVADTPSPCSRPTVDRSQRTLTVLGSPHPRIPMCPSKAPLTPRSDGRLLHFQDNGNAIFVTPAQHSKIQEPLVPVSKAEAIPTTIQSMAPHYRYWRENSGKQNSEEGFYSRRHHGAPSFINDPPPPHAIDLVDVQKHVNHEPTDTPFISTSQNFSWIIKQAIRVAMDGSQVMIAVINPRKLRFPAMHAQPFIERIRNKVEMKPGNHRWRGKPERFHWGHIPADAIVKTVQMQQLYQEVEKDLELSSLLRLDTLMQSNRSDITKRKRLATPKIPLSTSVVSATAKLALHLGIDVHLPEMLPHFVRDILQGFRIEVGQHQTTEKWVGLRSTFCHVMSRYEEKALSTKQQEVLRTALIEGVKWSMADPDHVHKELSALHKRWHNAGLESLDDILTYEHKALRHEQADSKTMSQGLLAITQRRAAQINVLRSGSPVRSSELLEIREDTMDIDDPEDLYDHAARTHRKMIYNEEIDWRDTVVRRM